MLTLEIIPDVIYKLIGEIVQVSTIHKIPCMKNDGEHVGRGHVLKCVLLLRCGILIKGQCDPSVDCKPLVHGMNWMTKITDRVRLFEYSSSCFLTFQLYGRYPTYFVALNALLYKMATSCVQSMARIRNKYCKGI